VIQDFGAVFEVQGLEVPVDTDRDYRIVFDVSQSPTGSEGVNPYLNSVARFLNMHARAGVPRARMELAVVLHGSAGKDALQPGPYRERLGAENPNVELIRQLAAAGVEFYICGQTAMSRGLPNDDLLPEIQMALSAMTARAMLQARGYEVVN
jgi:intracellular sulfur oxidation DsrE/DsrF family protein